MKESYNLIDFKENVFSEFGEDGILSKILKEMNIEDGWFVEFGAWDGIHSCNTKLLSNKGWKGIFIEGDAEKFQELKKNYVSNKKVITINRFVSPSGKNSLDNILQETPIPKEFEILSIDVDGNDYYIWESLKQYRPKVVLIECNFTFPYNIEFIQKKDEYIGASALSLYKLGLKKGYKLICFNSTNCFFVRNDFIKNFNLLNSSFSYLFHIGRVKAAGGFFVSEFNGIWHSLYSKPIAWGFHRKSIMERFLYLRNRATIFIDNKELRKKSKIFRIIEDSQELLSLFKENEES